MDADRFDRWAKVFGRVTSRRGVLLTGVAGGLGLLGRGAVAKPRHQRPVGGAAVKNGCARLCAVAFPRDGAGRRHCLRLAARGRVACGCLSFCREVFNGDRQQQVACLRAEVSGAADGLCRQCGADPDQYHDGGCADCGAHAHPEQGTCVCDPDYDRCGGVCVLRGSNANCGGACETCAPAESCGGGGIPGVCGQCAPRTTCPSLACGEIGDGCGGTLACGACPAGADCLSKTCVCRHRLCPDGNSSVCLAGEICNAGASDLKCCCSPNGNTRVQCTPGSNAICCSGYCGSNGVCAEPPAG